MSYRDDRRQEILDGKRRWSIEDADGDADVFFTQFVLPLQEVSPEAVGAIFAVRSFELTQPGTNR